jgi:hypothetical protein
MVAALVASPSQAKDAFELAIALLPSSISFSVTTTRGKSMKVSWFDPWDKRTPIDTLVPAQE